MIKSNTTNERKSEQAFIPHAPTLCDSVAQNVWQCHAFWIGQSDKKKSLSNISNTRRHTNSQ